MPRHRRSLPPAPPRRATAKVAPIAVVGASAGGLEAFRRLLSALPAKSGMAFILVPHLDPGRESHMVALLAASSAMPVAAARNGQRIQLNRVYVIPPNRLLKVHGGRFGLTPLPHPRAGSTALDLALRSLAEDQGAKAVGIVLSGTGTHGAAGLAQILRAGGLALAQDPATAQYDQMPGGAASVGVSPQHILAPEAMVPVLLARAAHLAGAGTGRHDPSSRSARFFKDPDALDVLATEALPDLVERASAEFPVRVWVPGCGSGEEAYSIAILLRERLEPAGKDAALKVFATDADPESLRVARAGIYPDSIAATVSPDRLARFFTPVLTDRYQVCSELRQAVVFGQVRLFEDPPISKLDLLVYRAPAAGLRPEAHAGLISRLHFALSPGGYLLLGADGPRPMASGLFETVSEQGSLLRKCGAAGRPSVREHTVTVRRGEAGKGSAPRAGQHEKAAAIMDHALLDRLAPAAVLTNVRYRILATRGPVTKYLQISSRARLPSLLAAAGASLRAATRSACEEALRHDRWARHGGSWKRRDGHLLRCNVSARPVRSRSSEEPLLLVIFEDDLEASSEQITSMNEELQSSNEEMQAMNEELESSKASLRERTEASERVEAQLRAVLDATVDAVVTINPDGRIMTFNGSASRMFGYSLQEVIGRNVNVLMPPELRALHDEHLARYRSTHRRHVIGTSREVVAYRRDGTRFPALLSVSETAGADLLVGCLRDLSADKALQEEILHIAALEQERIGQELHDGMQQELTGLGLLAQSLAEELRAQPDAGKAELAQRLAAGIAEANRHVRSLARGLVPVPVDAETLPSALRELARTTQETYKLTCRLDCPAPLKMPDAATATHLYRIAQEAVGNAAKHARAESVLIRLASADDRLRLEIHDDGIGIPPQPAATGGVGLRLMEHRCAAIGGRFTVEPRAGGGTVVACTVRFPGRS